MTTSKKTTTKRGPKGMKANQRITPPSAASDATGAGGGKRAKGIEKPPILSGADAVAALTGKGKKRPWRERSADLNQQREQKFQEQQKVTDTIDAGGGIMVDIVEKVSPEQKVASAAGEALSQTPTPTTTKARKPRASKESGKMSGLDAAAKVLGEAEMPLNAKMIVERMLAQGLWSSGGKTPAATIYSAMIREIDHKPGASRFKKTDRGLFTLAQPKT